MARRVTKAPDADAQGAVVSAPQAGSPDALAEVLDKLGMGGVAPATTVVVQPPPDARVQAPPTGFAPPPIPGAPGAPSAPPATPPAPALEPPVPTDDRTLGEVAAAAQPASRADARRSRLLGASFQDAVPGVQPDFSEKPAAVPIPPAVVGRVGSLAPTPPLPLDRGHSEGPGGAGAPSGVRYMHRIHVVDAYQFDGRVAAAPDWVDRGWLAYNDGVALLVPVAPMGTSAWCNIGDFVVRQNVLVDTADGVGWLNGETAVVTRAEFDRLYRKVA